MEFGVYVHRQGPQVLLVAGAKLLATHVKTAVGEVLGEQGVDGLYFSIMSTPLLYDGYKVAKKRSRSNYSMKLITGGRQFYLNLIEIDLHVPDADVCELTSEAAVAEYLREILADALKKPPKGSSSAAVTRVLSALAGEI